MNIDDKISRILGGISTERKQIQAIKCAIRDEIETKADKLRLEINSVWIVDVLMEDIRQLLGAK